MHTIRLHGPWQIQVDDRTVETTIPADWGTALGADHPGPARYVRRFGLPTNLSPEETVSLVVGGIDWQGELTLNGAALGTQSWADGERRYDITQLLKPRNELQIVITLPQSIEVQEQRAGSERNGKPGGLLGSVRLEIS